MPKKTIITLLTTILIVVAVSAVVIPGKIEQYKSAEKQEERAQQKEIIAEAEEDGSVTYHVPLTVNNNESGETETQYFTANSKDLPAIISVEVNGETQHLLFNVDAEGKASLLLIPAELTGGKNDFIK